MSEKKFDGSGISLDQLRAKQSVRTTFKLPQEVIALLSVLSGQLGIKQKSLIDQLTEDISVLNNIARNVESPPKRRTPCQQKTFVMSKSALQAINEVAQKRGIPRDILLELSIRRLLPVVTEEQEKHQKRKVVFEKLVEQLRSLENLRMKSRVLLGEDDDVYHMVEAQVQLARKNILITEELIKKGRALEEW